MVAVQGSFIVIARGVLQRLGSRRRRAAHSVVPAGLLQFGVVVLHQHLFVQGLVRVVVVLHKRRPMPVLKGIAVRRRRVVDRWPELRKAYHHFVVWRIVANRLLKLRRLSGQMLDGLTVALACLDWLFAVNLCQLVQIFLHSLPPQVLNGLLDVVLVLLDL